MFDILTGLAVISVILGIGLVRRMPLHKRIWIGLALAAGAYCSAAIGLAFIRAGLDSAPFLYARAGSFGALAIMSVIFLVPSCQDWLRAKWRARGDWEDRPAR
jgi:hypothetical protein